MIQNSSQEISSKHTKIKVALGYLVILMIIFILAYIAFVNFNKITSSIDSLSKSKNETTIIKQIDSGILEIRTSSEIFSNTFNSKDYDKYINNIQNTQKLIDSLQQELLVKGNQAQADSLHTMFQEYISSINEWLQVKKISASENNNEIRKLLKKDKSYASKLNEIAPEYTTTTITKIIEKPIPKNTSAPKDSVTESAFKRFFKKLFTTERPKPKIEPEVKTEAVQEITTESSVEKDTLYENQVKAFITELNQAIVKAEKTKNFHNKELARLKKELISNQTVIIQNLDALLKDIENENKIKVSESIELTKITAEKASVSLIFVVVIALVFSVVFMYAIFSDLTQSARYKQMLINSQKETEKLSKTKEEFLANMSHEIRTPLTGIIGFSEQLKDQPNPEKQSRILNSIINSSEHLLAVVNDILDYYKIESGNLHLEKHNFNVQEIFEKVVNIMQFDAEKKGIQLNYQVDFKNITLLNGDALRLQQVLLNLLSNAIKFTEKGSVTIQANVSEQAGFYLLNCSITDTGIGISENQLQNIFLDFTQADTSITRKYGGTGLGLPICKKIIESQQGKISVTSEVDKGSSFSFEIPYHKPIIENKPKNVVDLPQLKNKSIIVIDDDVTTERLLTPIFKVIPMNYSFYQASKLGWEELKKKTFDLIIVDIQMPEMDGRELIQKILLDSESKNKTSKIIVCTANIMINQKELKQWSPNIQIIHKPFRKNDFLNTLNSSIKNNLNEIKMTNNSLMYNLESFNQFADNDLDLVKSFVTSFIEESTKDLLEMKSFLAHKEGKSIGEIAHRLKNTYGHLAIAEATPILFDMEKLITEKQPDFTIVESQIKKLFEISNVVFEQLKQNVLDN